MEVYSVHSTIERKLKKKQVLNPAGYVTIIQEARSVNTYHVKYVDHCFFKDFASMSYRSSIRPGNRVGDPQVIDLVALKYAPDGSIAFKLNIDILYHVA